MRLLVIEDHRILREGIVACLEREFPSATLGQADSDRDARAILEEGWDVALLDLGLPDGSGFGLLGCMKRMSPKIKVIVLTASAEEDCGIPALDGGADGFITKTASFSNVADAIRQVIAGRRYFSHSLAERVLAVGPRDSGEPAPLSGRELDVLRLAAGGLTSAEIARLLIVSSKTVETYRARIYKKLNVRGLAALVRYALTHQLVASAAVPSADSLPRNGRGITTAIHQ